jgi:hypothetical protein
MSAAYVVVAPELEPPTTTVLEASQRGHLGLRRVSLGQEHAELPVREKEK